MEFYWYSNNSIYPITQNTYSIIKSQWYIHISVNKQTNDWGKAHKQIILGLDWIKIWLGGGP